MGRLAFIDEPAITSDGGPTHRGLIRSRVKRDRRRRRRRNGGG